MPIGLESGLMDFVSVGPIPPRDLQKTVEFAAKILGNQVSIFRRSSQITLLVLSRSELFDRARTPIVSFT